MDPNEALARLRTYMDSYDSWDSSECENVQDLFRGLDQWLSRGGYFPNDWIHPIDIMSLGE